MGSSEALMIRVKQSPSRQTGTGLVTAMLNVRVASRSHVLLVKGRVDLGGDNLLAPHTASIQHALSTFQSSRPVLLRLA